MISRSTLVCEPDGVASKFQVRAAVGRFVRPKNEARWRDAHSDRPRGAVRGPINRWIGVTGVACGQRQSGLAPTLAAVRRKELRLCAEPRRWTRR